MPKAWRRCTSAASKRWRMAIEAKDECTHEHLKRVQVYSLKIAEHLGLAPEQVRALQAAAILHDLAN